MSKKKKKKSLMRSRFYRVYFTVVAAALVLILVGTVWLMSYLRDLESAEPIYVARDVAALFENGDYENLYRMDGSAASVGSRDFYVENMRQITDGKAMAWSEVFDENNDEHRYAVTVDGERFATFTLVPNGKTNRRGHRLWTLGTLQTNVAVVEPEIEAPEPEVPAVTTQVKVTAPRGYAVTVDGTALSAQNAAVTEKPLYEEGFLPDNVQNPVMVTYEYGAQSEAPQVAATDGYGSPVTLAQAGENAWSCGLAEDQNLSAKYSEAAYSLAQKIAKYTSKDGSRDAILKYCAADSPARTTFKNLSNQYATPHSEIAFENASVTEFYPLSDDCFTCKVRFDYLMKTSDGMRTDPTVYTFCILTSGKEPKLYNLLMG